MQPGYLKISKEELRQKKDTALDKLKACTICPRQCQVNRLNGETGFCQTGRNAYIASYNLHFGEEKPLVGKNGSGTIFFAGCNLCCVFCQNYDISHSLQGAMEVLPEQLAAVMLDLQAQGALNINLVTPTHVLPQILEALIIATEKGLHLPLVYNCGGYEKLKSLQLLEGLMDIYMPDIKFAREEEGQRYCQAKDYPQVARLALKEMHRQCGDLQLNSAGVAEKGLLVRHLLLPHKLAGTKDWMQFLAREISLHTYLNIMDQYRPCGQARHFPELNQGISRQEWEEARQLARNLGLIRLDERDRSNLEQLLFWLNK